MTISSTTSRVSYPGAASTGPFAFPFRIFAYSDLLVTKRATTGAETTLTYGGDYSVSGVGNATGSVTLSVALAVGEVLTLRRVPSLVQPTSITTQGAFFAKTHEDEFDRLVMQLQDVRDRVDRAFGLLETYDPASYSMRVKPETGKVVGWLSSTELGNLALDSSADVALPGGGRTVATLTEYLANNAVFNARDFGMVGDGVTDDSDVLQAAIDAARDAGGGIVIIDKPGHTVLVSKQGSINSLNYCVRLRDNVTVQITSGTTVAASGASDPAVVFLARGLGTLDSVFPTTTLGADAAIRSSTIQVADSSDFTIGDDIFIEDDNGFEVNEVLTIPDGTHLGLRRITRFAYTTAASCKVSVIGFMQNVHLFGGGTIDGGGVSADAIVQFSDVKESSCVGMRLTNSGGTGRGLLFSSRSHRNLGERNVIWAIADRGMETYTQTSENTFRNNWVRDAGVHGVVLHGNNNLSVDDTAVACGTDPASHANFHMDSAQHCAFINPRSYASVGRGLQADGGTIKHLTILGGHIQGASDLGLYITAASDVWVQGIDVSGGAASGVKFNAVTRGRFHGRSRGNAGNGFWHTGVGADIYVGGDCGGNVRGLRFDTLPTGLIIDPTINLRGNSVDAILTAGATPVQVGMMLGANSGQLIRGEVILGRLMAADMNSTSDQAIAIGSKNYRITRIMVTDATGSLSTAAGGVYTAAAKGGTAVVAAGQAYSALTTSAKILDLTLAVTDRRTDETLYLSLSTPQGSAMTAAVYVCGIALD